MDITEVLGKVVSTKTVKLDSREEEVQIKKVSLNTAKPVIDLIRKVYTQLAPDQTGLPPAIQSMFIDDGADPNQPIDEAQIILKLIAEFFDETVSIAASLCSLTEDELRDLDMDESLVVILAIVELNKDFFTTRVATMLPALKSLYQKEEKRADKKVAKTT